MVRQVPGRLLWRPFVLCLLVAACTALSPTHSPLWAASASSFSPCPEPAAPESREPLPQAVAPPENAAAPFAGMKELSAETLVQEVLARNPSLAQMMAAWQAVSARYPQVTSLEDPMFAATIGPGTIAPDDRGVEFASRLEIAQKYPWPGKLRARGQNALAEASAAGHDVDDTRLRLVESTREAFAEYYWTARALDVNKEALRLLGEFRQNAETRYRLGSVPQQDVLQADVEIGRQQEQQLRLERMHRVAIARINTLLNMDPDALLPPPPAQLSVADALPDVSALRATAVARRPDLQALADHIAAEEASLRLACKEYYPDLEPFVMYDRFMGNTTSTRDLATMVGVRLNLPVRRARRDGAVAEAQARITQRRAELAGRVNQVNFEVQQAYEQVRESERVVRLYESKIGPAARENVKAAQSAYVTAKIPFLSLVEAQRSEVDTRARYFQAVADYFRRRAALERAVGGPLDPLSGGG